MNTFTDKELIKEIKERIGSLDVRDNIERRAYEIALASLEAEPVAKIIAHYPLGIDVGKQKFVQAIGELPDFGGHLFAAPPAAVVPDDGREKFEALVRFHAGDKNHETLLLRANEGMNYQDPNVDLAWIFWKSSREHI
ncbi:TPA: hypothetical protein J1067_003299 [Escherichia coli]|nr:hypothetical protein [Escherichia coli]HAL9525803.1 hypothetical protein [Escherichia coli]HAZ3608243.1 hypothetical protein [Escherichia coli]HAZ3678814.1 hypothetical protein [Escherichia coli]HBA8274537.1 hypothetical protein [Escherichia coli]